MVDVTVRGAGIFGLSIAWACVERGARVQVIDPFGPGAGSSGGIVGALAPHVPENWNAKKAFQLDSLLMAKHFWSEVATAGGKTPGYVRSGRVQPIADDAALVLARKRAETAKELWQGAAKWQVIQASDSPWEPLSPTGWLVHDTLSGLLHPRRAVDALVAALAARGTIIQTNGEDRGAVLWATGVQGLAALSAGHTRSVGAGVKGQAALVDLDMRGKPQLFADGLHIVPHSDGTVAIGSTSERAYDEPDTTDTQLDDILEKARRLFPAIGAAPVLQRWAGVRPRARSRAPMLGPWPGKPGHFIANGGFKIGFGMAPKVAQVMADLILDEKDNIPPGFEVSASF